MKKNTKSLAELLNESNTNSIHSIREDQDRINLADGGFSEGIQFPTRLGTVYVDVSDITRTGVTVDIAFSPEGGNLNNDSEIVRVTISPDRTIKVVDRSSGNF
jgi:hypothetical protein